MQKRENGKKKTTKPVESERLPTCLCQRDTLKFMNQVWAPVLRFFFFLCRRFSLVASVLRGERGERLERRGGEGLEIRRAGQMLWIVGDKGDGGEISAADQMQR